MRGKVHAVTRHWGEGTGDAWCGLDSRLHAFASVTHGRGAKLDGKVTCGHCVNTARLLGKLTKKRLRELAKA